MLARLITTNFGILSFSFNASQVFLTWNRKLIGFELDDEMKDVEDRLLKWSEARLRHEGVALFRLAGKLAVIFSFSFSR